LYLDHLNKKNASHVNRIINKYSDLIRLPDEPLDHTDVTANKIVATDDRPINIKQYKFPSIYKDEINKQVKDLMMNDVIDFRFAI